MAFRIRSLLLLALMGVLAPIRSQQFGEQRLCGEDLVEALHLVCGDRGFYYGRGSRGIEESLEGDGVGELAFRPRVLRKRGVVDQCCYSVCSLDVLESYCNP